MSEFEIGMKVRHAVGHPDSGEIIGVHGDFLWIDPLKEDWVPFGARKQNWEPIPTTIPVMLEVEDVKRIASWNFAREPMIAACHDALAKHREGSHE